MVVLAVAFNLSIFFLHVQMPPKKGQNVPNKRRKNVSENLPKDKNPPEAPPEKKRKTSGSLFQLR